MFANFNADEADSLTYRAHREAARCWAEFRACDDPIVRKVLLDAAKSADAFWAECRDAAREIRAREDREERELVTCRGMNPKNGLDAAQPLVTEADLADEYDRQMDGGNYHSDGSPHTGDDDGHHPREEDASREANFGPVWNADGSPADVTIAMLDGTGRTAADGSIS